MYCCDYAVTLSHACSRKRTLDVIARMEELLRLPALALESVAADAREGEAAAARWAAGAGRKKPRAKKGKALNDELSDRHE